MWIIEICHSFHRLACPMLSTTGFQEENDCGINYFWRRLSQISPLNWIGWMVISQTVQAYVYCIHLLETLPSIFENSARGMLCQDLMPFTLSFWPFFFGHCLLSLLLLSCQVRITFKRATWQFTHEKRLHWCNLSFIYWWTMDKSCGANNLFQVTCVLFKMHCHIIPAYTWWDHRSRAHLCWGNAGRQACVVSLQQVIRNAAMPRYTQRHSAFLLWEHGVTNCVYMITTFSYPTRIPAAGIC